MLASVGLRRAVTKGELLYRAGDATYDIYVVTSGRIAIVDHHAIPIAASIFLDVLNVFQLFLLLFGGGRDE